MQQGLDGIQIRVLPIEDDLVVKELPEKRKIEVGIPVCGSHCIQSRNAAHSILSGYEKIRPYFRRPVVTRINSIQPELA